MVLSPRVRRAIEAALVLAGLVAAYWLRWRWQANGFRYGGSDTYGYINLAHELGAHHRYALGPWPEPLAWARVPLYPVFLAIVQPAITGRGPWDDAVNAQLALDTLTCLFVYLIGRRLGGVAGGALAMALAVVNPFTPAFAATVLTETLATCLTAATVAAVLLGAARPRVGWPIAGALLGLSVLTRPDGLLLAVAFIPPWLAMRRPWRDKLRVAAFALAGFVVVYAPWPLRNLARFGEPHWVGAQVDRFTRPVAHYDGYFHWLRSWAPDWKPQTVPVGCFYDLSCPAGRLDLRRRGAYVDLDDEREVTALLQRRAREGLSAGVSDGFEALARARRRAHPWHVLVGLPLSRAWNMWVAPFDELYQIRTPWPELVSQLRPYLADLARDQLFAIVAAGAFLVARRRTRVDAAALGLCIVVRTAVLAWSFYCMPRYAIEAMPLGWALVGAAPVELVRAGRSLWALRRRRATVSSER